MKIDDGRAKYFFDTFYDHRHRAISRYGREASRMGKSERWWAFANAEENYSLKMDTMIKVLDVISPKKKIGSWIGFDRLSYLLMRHYSEAKKFIRSPGYKFYKNNRNMDKYRKQILEFENACLDVLNKIIVMLRLKGLLWKN